MNSISSALNIVINRISIIVLFGLMLSACDQTKSESSVRYLNSKEYQYHISVGNPKGYDVVYEYRHSYFMDNNEEPLLYFGGNIGTGGGWGSGSQNTSLSGKYPLPKGFKVRWYSTVEDQFWEGEFDFSKEQLSELFNQGFIDIDNGNGREYYSNFTINVAPGGLVSVWLDGGSQTVQLGLYQAHKITMDWEEFTKFSLEYSIDREAYRVLVLDDVSADNLVRQQIKEGTVPTDSGPWKRLQKKYDWRFNVEPPFKLIDFRIWYANAESYYTYPNELAKAKFRAPPYRISMDVLLPNGTKEELQLFLNKEYIVEIFEKFEQPGYDQLELSLWLANDLSEAKLYLLRGDTKVEIDIQEIYLSDYSNN